MNWTKLTKRTTLSALAFTACAAVAAPMLSMNEVGEGDAEWTAKDETTIRLRLHEGDPIVLKLDDMKVGDVRTMRENGKDVTVTRDADGFLVNVDGKEIRVLADLEGAGAGHVVVLGGKPGDADGKKFVFHSIDTDDGSKDGKAHKRVVIREGGPGVFAFRSGDAKPVKGEDLLSKNELDSLRGADSRTRDAVAKALDELMAKGVIIAPGCALPRMTATTGTAGDGAVEVQVERRKSETR